MARDAHDRDAVDIDDGSETDALEDDVLVTGEAVVLSLRPASFAQRAGGALIDGAIAILLYVLLMWGLVTIVVNDPPPEGLIWTLLITVWVICFLVLPFAVELLAHGKSLGRLAVGVRIVRDDGGAAGVRQAFVRAVIGSVEFFTLFGGPAVISGLLTRRAQRIGDLLAGTYALAERVPAPRTAGFGVPWELTQWARIADPGRLPAPLARRISQFLGMAGGYDPVRRQAIARSLAIETAAWVHPLPAVDPELFLAAVARLRRERFARALALEQQRIDALAPALTRLPPGFPDRG